MLSAVVKIVRRTLINPRRTGLGSAVKILDSNFGSSRGTPIDRILIENFLVSEFAMCHEKMRVLEFADQIYSSKYFPNCNNYCFKFKPKSRVIETASNEIEGDLLEGTAAEVPKFDLIIATQLLAFTENPFIVARTLLEMLAPNGRIIGTEPFLSPLSTFDDERWGDFFRFTGRGIEKIYSSSGEKNLVIDVKPLGNWESSYSLIKGLVFEDNIQLSDEACRSHATNFGYRVARID